MLISKRLAKLEVGYISSVIIDDFLLICGLRVNLTAIIIGDIKGHTFLWEQVEGTTVGITYLSPMNTLLLDFAIEIPPGIRDDKKFRFWIDKGSTREQYYDVWVWSSFVDKYKPNLNKNTGTNDFNNVYQVSAQSTVNAYCDYSPNYYQNLTNTNNTPTVYLYWVDNNTSTFTQLLNYFIEYYNTSVGEWQVFKYNASNFLDTSISANIAYRVVANYYNTKTSQISRLYSNTVSYNSQDTRWSVPPIFYNDYYKTNTNNHIATTDFNTVSNYVNYVVENLLFIDEYGSNINKNNSVNEHNVVSNYINYLVVNLIILPINSNDYYAAHDSYGNVNEFNVVTSYQNFTNINIGG